MFRPKEYSEAERRLAGLARKIAINRDVPGSGPVN